MEAKDIVAKEVARQAEFGMEPSWEDFVYAGREAGIREVVEYVNIKSDTPDEDSMGRPPGYFVVNTKEWKAKLREWGI